MPLTAQSALRKDRTTVTGSGVKLEHRHFAMIAAIIKDLHSLPSEADRTWVAEHFANELARTNPRFDRTRFLIACDATDRL